MTWLSIPLPTELRKFKCDCGRTNWEAEIDSEDACHVKLSCGSCGNELEKQLQIPQDITDQSKTKSNRFVQPNRYRKMRAKFSSILDEVAETLEARGSSALASEVDAASVKLKQVKAGVKVGPKTKAAFKDVILKNVWPELKKAFPDMFDKRPIFVSAGDKEDIRAHFHVSEDVTEESKLGKKLQAFGEKLSKKFLSKVGTTPGTWISDTSDGPWPSGQMAFTFTVGPSKSDFAGGE